MAKKNARGNDEVNGNVNLSPMIDCCFLLLIFFVVNATQITVAKDPSVKMPSAVSCSELKDANGCIVVNVFSDVDKMSAKALEKYNKAYPPNSLWGVADANGNPIGYTAGQVQELTDFVKKQKESLKGKGIEDGKIRLYLRGDLDAPWERSSTAIRCAAAAGVTNIVFGTLPSK